MNTTSPCMSCNSTPCCSHLEIFAFPILTAKDLDQAIYFSNFTHIETTLTQQWQCKVYFRSQCRHLAHESGCTVHNTSEQPLVCVNYSPYGCFFTSGMREKQQPKSNLIWMNTRRWQELCGAINVDEQNRILLPNWNNLASFMAGIEYEEIQIQSSTEVADAPYTNWLIASEKQNFSQDLQTFNLTQYRNICANCSSWCCTHLAVPFKTPAQFKDIDYLRYCLNFPGTQVVISDRGWSLLVKTPCEHLDGNKCAIFGKPERPKICRYYPEQDCYYRKTTAKVRPDNYIRLAQPEFELATELFRFDAEGNLLNTPEADQIRVLIEQKLACHQTHSAI